MTKLDQEKTGKVLEPNYWVRRNVIPEKDTWINKDGRKLGATVRTVNHYVDLCFVKEVSGLFVPIGDNQEALVYGWGDYIDLNDYIRVGDNSSMNYVLRDAVPSSSLVWEVDRKGTRGDVLIVPREDDKGIYCYQPEEWIDLSGYVPVSETSNLNAGEVVSKEITDRLKIERQKLVQSRQDEVKKSEAKERLDELQKKITQTWQDVIDNTSEKKPKATDWFAEYQKQVVDNWLQPREKTLLDFWTTHKKNPIVVRDWLFTPKENETKKEESGLTEMEDYVNKYPPFQRPNKFLTNAEMSEMFLIAEHRVRARQTLKTMKRRIKQEDVGITSKAHFLEEIEKVWDSFAK